MKKSLLIKFFILLFVIILSYCVFWFFKAGQSEKAFNQAIKEASAFISTTGIKVSGFPTKQKFTLEGIAANLNSGIFKNHKILISKAEIESGIFSDEYKIQMVGGVKLEDQDNPGRILEVKLSSTPNISVKLKSGQITEFSYNDSGFTISDETNQDIFAAMSSSVRIMNNYDKDGKVSINVDGTISGIDHFDATNIFQNLFEKRVVEGLRNDEIKVNLPETLNVTEAKTTFINFHKMKLANPSFAATGNFDPLAGMQVLDQVLANGQFVQDPNFTTPQQPGQAIPNPNSPINSSLPNQHNSHTNPQISPNDPNLAHNGHQANHGNPPAIIPQQPSIAAYQGNQPAPNSPSPVQIPNPNIASPTPPSAQEMQPGQNPAAPGAPDMMAGGYPEDDFMRDMIKKGNLSFSFVIELASNGAANSAVAIDGAQEAASSSGDLLKISEIKFTKNNYEISVNGTLTKSPDDAMPSGGLSVKISNFSTLLKEFDDGIDKLFIGADKYSEIAKPKTGVSDISSNSPGFDPNFPNPSSPNQNASPELNNIAAAPQNPTIAQAPNSPTAPQQPSPMPTNSPNLAISSAAANTQNPANPGNQPSMQDAATGNIDQNFMTNSTPIAHNMNDYYSFFLIKFATLYLPITLELASKNTVTKENVAQFDIRREKNLEFFVNETPVREVLGRLQ